MTDCERFGHDFSSYYTEKVDAWGMQTRRVYYCTWCGLERRGKDLHKEEER
jgi:hypothetical protein